MEWIINKLRLICKRTHLQISTAGDNYSTLVQYLTSTSLKNAAVTLREIYFERPEIGFYILRSLLVLSHFIYGQKKKKKHSTDLNTNRYLDFQCEQQHRYVLVATVWS